MTATANRANLPGAEPPEPVRAAFRDLHGTRLHGFALLVTLGDRARAARLAGEALAEGQARAAELRHPERAAAWLRRRVARGAARRGRPLRRHDAAPERRLALEVLGVDGAGFAGLAALTIRERAAIVADSVERFDRGDVATIVGVDGARLDRLIRRTRGRYGAIVAEALDDASATAGPTAARIRAVATRALM
jgi:DNA-directed RNA polymerase specialized sigma24 family protein